MKILLAPDKFKGSLKAEEVCSILAEEIQSISATFKVESLPLADGGEGTAGLLTTLSGGHQTRVMVKDPLLRDISTSYGVDRDGKTAFIEMANASGLQNLAVDERRCMITSTFGTGQLIAHALNNGIRKIIIGLGGSATNDAGLGMARALGFKLMGQNGVHLIGRGEDLNFLADIDRRDAHPAIAETEFIALTDVTNPLYGPHGAAYTFARQKGATDDEIKILDEGLRRFSAIATRENYSLEFKGAGAAGGLGAGVCYFLNAKIESGIDFISAHTRLEERIKKADIVITGEGKLDRQSMRGKVVHGVSQLARQHQKKLFVVTGVCELDDDDLKELGINQVVSLVNAHTDPATAISNAAQILRQRVREFNW